MKVVSEARLYERIGYEPHAGQVEILGSHARNKVVAAGRRFGKSDIGGHRLVTECFLAYYMRKELADTDKRREFWIVGPEYTDSEKEFRVLWNVLKRLQVPFDKPGSYNDPIGGNMHLSVWEGRFQVHAKSAKHPETLVGEGLNGVILAEAAKLKQKIWTKFLRPMLADYSGWSLMTSTPEGKNWFYEAWQDGQNPLRLDWDSWRRPSWTNPYVYKTPTIYADILRAMKLLERGPEPGREDQWRAMLDSLTIDGEVMSLLEDLPDPTFNQEIAALFTEFVGRVFATFDEETHVGDFPFNPKWQTYGAVDYGFTNPNVWLLVQVGPWGEIRVIDELYEPGLTDAEFGNRILERNLCPSSMIAFFPDPADPSATKTLEDKLKVRARGGTGGEVKDRVNAIRAALKFRLPHLEEGHPERVPTLMIDRKCKNTIRDFNDYRYPDRRDKQEANKPENPMKKDDHAPEALGRFFAGMQLTKPRRTRQRSSSLAD